MKVGKVGVEFGFLKELTLPPVVQGHGLLSVGGCGVPGRADSPPRPSSKKSPVCAFLLFGSPQERHRWRGTCGESYLFFFCAFLSRTPPPPPMRPLLAMPCAFSETVINSLLDLQSSHTAFVNPPVLVSALVDETLALFLLCSGLSVDPWA